MVSSRYFLPVVSGLEYTFGIPGNLPKLYLIKAIFCYEIDSVSPMHELYFIIFRGRFNTRSMASANGPCLL